VTNTPAYAQGGQLTTREDVGLRILADLGLDDPCLQMLDIDETPQRHPEPSVAVDERWWTRMVYHDGTTAGRMKIASYVRQWPVDQSRGRAP
jgi:hypothetical protein